MPKQIIMMSDEEFLELNRRYQNLRRLSKESTETGEFEEFDALYDNLAADLLSGEVLGNLLDELNQLRG